MIGHENKVRHLSREGQFFEKDRFQTFEEDIKNQKGRIKIENIQELMIKCYGYGYFEQQGRQRQTQLKDNFFIYLKQALFKCGGLKALKIQFNGFSVRDKSLLKLISMIEDLTKGDKKPLETVWIHTRFLRDCPSSLVTQLLTLADRMIHSKVLQIEEISLQMQEWQFEQGPLTYANLQGQFRTFASNFKKQDTFFFKRLKLNLSSWYIHDQQAYRFLSESILPSAIVDKIEQAKVNRNKSSGQNQTDRGNILRFIKLIDEKYPIEHPIPGKGPGYISKDKEFNKRKKQYINKQIKQKANREDLLKVLKQDGGMPVIHRQALDNIQKQIQTLIVAQDKKIKDENDVIQVTNNLQKRISEDVIKSPFDIIMRQRVEIFHKLIVNFVSALRQNLGYMEEFQLDLRNWNPMFQMKDLKSMLTKQFAQEGGVRPLMQGSKIVPKMEEIRESAEEGSKLKCKFIM